MRRTNLVALVLAGVASAFLGCNALLGLEAGEPQGDAGDAASDTGAMADGGSDTSSPDTSGDSTSLDTGSTDTSSTDTSSTDTGKSDGAVEGAADAGGTDAGGYTFTFPVVGEDTASLSSFGTMCDKDNYLTGMRTTTLATVTSLDGVFELVFNSLGTDCPALPDAGGKDTIEVTLNGVVVGSFPVLPSSGTSIPVALTFPPVTGPSYTLKLRSKFTVPSGCGCFEPKAESKYTLR